MRNLKRLKTSEFRLFDKTKETMDGETIRKTERIMLEKNIPTAMFPFLISSHSSRLEVSLSKNLVDM
jgi:hypothetical protein